MSVRRSRAGEGYFKFLAVVTVVGLVMVIGYIVWASGDWQFWKQENLDTALDDAKDLTANSGEALARLREEAWGEGGLVDDMKDWLKSRPPPPEDAAAPPEEDPGSKPPPTEGPTSPPVARVDEGPVKPPPAKPAPRSTTSEVTKRLARKLYNAEDSFAEGMEHYKAANPAKGGASDRTFTEVRKARDIFAGVRDTLYAAIPAYERRPDHSPRTLARAKELQRRNQLMFANANKQVR